MGKLPLESSMKNENSSGVSPGLVVAVSWKDSVDPKVIPCKFSLKEWRPAHLTQRDLTWDCPRQRSHCSDPADVSVPSVAKSEITMLFDAAEPPR